MNRSFTYRKRNLLLHSWILLLVFVFDTTRTGTLHGSASVSHQSGQLKSGQVALDLDRHLISAHSPTPEDTLSNPVLIRESDRRPPRGF